MSDADEKLREAVRERAEDGKVQCAAALEIARRLKVNPKRVGEACNAEKLKITRCQLGCFGWK